MTTRKLQAHVSLQVAVSQATPSQEHTPLLIRPTTPSNIGPTLRQIEHHFLETELQLEGIAGEMTARFDLTRTKMEATIKESEVKLKDDNVLLQQGSHGNEQPLLGNERLQDDGGASRPSTSRSGR